MFVYLEGKYYRAIFTDTIIFGQVYYICVMDLIPRPTWRWLATRNSSDTWLYSRNCTKSRITLFAKKTSVINKDLI